jgi:hypothetical protein
MGNTLTDSKGQAMPEMILGIPLLFLFMAGMVQFTLLFQAKTQFEHACGEAAREYSAGLIDPDRLKNEIWENLGNFRSYFNQNDIKISTGSPTSPIGRLMSHFGGFLTPLSHVLHDVGVDNPFSYGGYAWEITARCEMTPFFEPLFRQGVIFKTQLAVLRYPE